MIKDVYIFVIYLNVLFFTYSLLIFFKKWQIFLNHPYFHHPNITIINILVRAFWNFFLSILSLKGNKVQYCSHIFVPCFSCTFLKHFPCYLHIFYDHHFFFLRRLSLHPSLESLTYWNHPPLRYKTEQRKGKA